MKRVTLYVAFLGALATIPGTAAAGLRDPQIDFAQASLQQRFIDLGENIEVEGHQDAAMGWGTGPSNTSVLTLKFEIPAGADLSDGEIGIVRMIDQNTIDPVSTYLRVIPKFAQPDWYSVASFFEVGGVDKLVVNVFDGNGIIQDTYPYSNVNPALFCFYIKQDGNTYHSIDSFNADGKVHALAYRGTGANTGAFWLSWESSAIDGAYTEENFDDALVLMEELQVTPVTKSTWAAVKHRFR